MKGEQQEDPLGGAVFCPDCEMWLNGPTQWEDHKFGRRHKSNLQRKLQAGSGDAPRSTKLVPKKRPPPTPISGGPAGGAAGAVAAAGDAPAGGGDAGGNEPQPHTGSAVADQEQQQYAPTWPQAPAAGYHEYGSMPFMPPVIWVPQSHLQQQQFMGAPWGGHSLGVYPSQIYPLQPSGGGGGNYQY